MSGTKNVIKERMRLDILRELLKDLAIVNIDPYVEQAMTRKIESYGARTLRLPNTPHEMKSILVVRDYYRNHAKLTPGEDIKQVYDKLETEAFDMFNTSVYYTHKYSYSGITPEHRQALANMVILNYLHYTTIALHLAKANALIGNKNGLLVPRKDRVVATILEDFKQDEVDKKYLAVLKKSALTMYDCVSQVVEGYRRG